MLDPRLLALIDALAAAEVADYMAAQPAPANDPDRSRPNPPATGSAQEAA